MTELVFPSPLLADYRREAWATPYETCAVFFACPAPHDRVLVHDGGIVPVSAYATRTEIAAQLTPAFLFEAVQQAKKRRAHLVLSHTHTRPSDTTFSATDDRGEAALAPYLDAKLAGLGHYSVLMTRDGLLGRGIGKHQPIVVVELGATIRRHSLIEPSSSAAIEEIFERQARAFGAAGQRLISAVKVAIVGLGGTGSHVAQQLAYLGVANFLLVDPKRLTITNRNRVVGTVASDVGLPKVEIARRMILGIADIARVEPILLIATEN
jgi:molybdopterin-synthase adenylyltransferase